MVRCEKFWLARPSDWPAPAHLPNYLAAQLVKFPFGLKQLLAFGFRLSLPILPLFFAAFKLLNNFRICDEYFRQVCTKSLRYKRQSTTRYRYNSCSCRRCCCSTGSVTPTLPELFDWQLCQTLPFFCYFACRCE